MKLNERYNIMTACGIMTCDGKRYNDEFAIVHNWKEDVFNVTHIASGTAIKAYNTLEECLENVEKDIETASKYLEKNPEHKKRIIKVYNNCLKCKLFTNDYI